MTSAEDLHLRRRFERSGTRLGAAETARLRSALSTEHQTILRSVLQLHFATTTQLERLHFRIGNATALAATRRTNRTLARLHHLGLLDRLERRIGGERAGSSGYIWRISPGGGRILNRPQRCRRHEPGLIHLAHVLEVGELVVRLHEHARVSDVDLLAVETEPTCWRPFVGSHGGRSVLKSDLRVTLGVGDVALHWFVEVDRGTEDRTRLARKVSTYLAARQDGGEQARAGCFPRILWTVPDQQRADVLTAVCSAANRARPDLFAVAARDDAIEALATRKEEP